MNSSLDAKMVPCFRFFAFYQNALIHLPSPSFGCLLPIRIIAVAMLNTGNIDRGEPDWRFGDPKSPYLFSPKYLMQTFPREQTVILLQGTQIAVSDLKPIYTG